MSDKPTPLKVYGRSHYACTRCKLSKVKCLGEKPACANCKAVHKEDLCLYPTRDRKIVIMESDLNKLQSRVDHLEALLKAQTPYNFAPLLTHHTDHLAQRRILGSQALEFYIVPGLAGPIPTYPLLLLCSHLLPDEKYARALISTICRTYSSEFYLCDEEELTVLVDVIYEFFASHSLLTLSSAEDIIPSMSLCHFFIVLAFGEQIRNSTVDPLPASITEITGAPKKVPGLAFYNVASRLFNAATDNIDVQFIQCSVLLGLFACNLNCFNSVQTYFGIALRSAVANGYHRQICTDQDTNQSNVEGLKLKEKTKRLWWSIYVIEVVWCSKMTMPVHIDYTDTDVPLPNERPLVDLHDGFNTEILEVNVHLVKFLAQFNKLIYGPNIRTYSVNYINTEKFNQKLLVKNILASLKTIVQDFEEPYLWPYKTMNVIHATNRNVGNLILRYNQVVILVIAPLISIVFDQTAPLNVENKTEAFEAIDRGLASAIRTILTLVKFYEHGKLFVLGFWDSQHLFSAILIIIMASFAVDCGIHHNRAIALLKYMADHDNINAKNCLIKLRLVQESLNEIPEVNFNLDLDSEIDVYLRTPYFGSLEESAALKEQLEYFNPFQETDLPKLAKCCPSGLPKLVFECLGLTKLLPKSQGIVSNMARTVLGWDAFKGMSIHVNGTRMVVPPQVNERSLLGHSELQIKNLI